MLNTANTKLGLEHAVMRTSGSGYSEKHLTATGFAKSEKLDDSAVRQRATQIERLLRTGAQVHSHPLSTQEFVYSLSPHAPSTPFLPTLSPHPPSAPSLHIHRCCEVMSRMLRLPPIASPPSKRS